MSTKPYRYKTFAKINDLGFFAWFIVFIISTGIIALERYTPVYINNFYVRLFFYLVSASLFVFWVAWILFGFKAVKARVYLFFAVLIISVLKAALTWGGDWKTQILLYQNKTDSNQTVEFQMRADPFSFGYRKRIVEKTSVVPFFDYVKKSDTTQLDKAVWKRVDKRINALNLKNFNDEPCE